MVCGLGSPEEIAVCIHVAKRWLELASAVAGLGSLALISILIWMLRRLRHDVVMRESDADRERELRNKADENARNAAHRAALAENAQRSAEQQLEALTDSVRKSGDETKVEIADLRTRLGKERKRVDAALASTSDGTTGFWSRAVGPRLIDFEQRMSTSIPILLFGNQKGGVGKSTIVTNLAAAFAAQGERVLTIDLDYQGSHSSLAQGQAGRSQDEPESLVDYVFQDELSSDWRRLAIKQVTKNYDFISAFYSFERLERQIEYRWALGRTSDDVRYRLARALLSDEIQGTYSRILIDAPPRFTLGFVNGFCASTHLFVPTVVDSMSAPAASAFARQFAELRPIANPHIKWAGIIGTLTFANPRDPLTLTATAEPAALAAERAAQLRLKTRDELFIRRPVITRDAKLARATESGIAYLKEPDVRNMFDELAQVVAKRAPRRERK